MKILFILLSLLISLSCQTKTKRLTRLEFLAKQRTSPIHSKEYWNQWEGLPLEKRIVSATPEMISFLKSDNKYNGYNANPIPVTLTKEQKKIVLKTITSLPSWVKKPIEKKVTAIMIVDDLGSSAFSDGIYHYKNKGFIVFDIKTLTKNANDWCSWKENSAFKKGEYQIKCTIETGKNNNIEGAFRYIFLHEAAHMLQMGSSILPFWTESPKTQSDVDKYPFLKISWKLLKDKNLYKREKFKVINWVRFYIEKYAKKNERMVDAYKELKSSKFATLYGASNVWDDLAEAYVNYIHTKVLKKPFKIEIFKGDKKVFTYKNCWQEKRCQLKMKMVKDFIKGN